MSRAGVNCSGLVTTKQGEELVLFHSPFEEKLGEEEGHLTSFIGPAGNVYHSPTLGCHAYMFPPSDKHHFWTVVTMGLSGFEMTSESESERRCELMCLMPSDWTPPLTVGCPEHINAQNYMVESIMALAPHIVRSASLFKHNDGLAGNVFEGFDPMFEGTQLACYMLRRPDELLGEGFSSWTGENPYTHETCTVNFYVVIPLTMDEYNFRKENGSDVLFEKLKQAQGNAFISRFDRPSVQT